VEPLDSGLLLIPAGYVALFTEGGLLSACGWEFLFLFMLREALLKNTFTWRVGHWSDRAKKWGGLITSKKGIINANCKSGINLLTFLCLISTDGIRLLAVASFTLINHNSQIRKVTFLMEETINLVFYLLPLLISGSP